MKVLLSPSKTMRIKEIEGIKCTKPCFIDKTKELVDALKELDENQISRAMQISPDIAKDVVGYYENFNYDSNTPALASFTGLVYKRIAVDDFTIDDYNFAQEHFIILSALYGALLPLDAVSYYRLEMKTDWTLGGRKLYNYWEDKIYERIFSEDRVVVCLASNEYAKQLSPYIKEDDKYIVCSFLSGKNGRLQNKSTDAKIARGKMARYIIKKRINDPEELKKYNEDGYEFSENLSDDKNFVFVRK